MEKYMLYNYHRFCHLVNASLGWKKAESMVFSIGEEEENSCRLTVGL